MKESENITNKFVKEALNEDKNAVMDNFGKSLHDFRAAVDKKMRNTEVNTDSNKTNTKTKLSKTNIKELK